MRTNKELIGALNMVLARLESDKHNAAEWEIMRSTLAQATGYAQKCRDMRALLESRLETNKAI